VGVGGLGERVQAGDSSAFAELYGECADRLFGFCLVLLRDRDEAADAAQDAFVLAVQRASQLRNADRLHAWLFAIARHVCYRRLEQRQRVVPRNLPPDVLVLDDDPVDGIAAEEAAALVWAAAAGLSERSTRARSGSFRARLARLAPRMSVVTAMQVLLLSGVRRVTLESRGGWMIWRFGDVVIWRCEGTAIRR